MRLVLLGLGLVGGSIARAIRSREGAGTPGPASEPHSIVAWTPDGRGPRAALQAGVIDVAARSLEEAVDGASLVILAGPPDACLVLLGDLAAGRSFARTRDLLVTDVASTKGAIVARAAELGLPFVGGHPMAGRETSGFAAADGSLFAGRPWVVVPARSSPPGGVARVMAFAADCGALPVVMDAAEHDAAVAAISHLPLVVAAALVEAIIGRGSGPGRPNWPAARALAATGWASATRLARGDAEMAAGIAVTNGPAIAARIRDLEAVLADWRATIERGDRDELRARFGAARQRLETAADEDGAGQR